MYTFSFQPFNKIYSIPLCNVFYQNIYHSKRSTLNRKKYTITVLYFFFPTQCITSQSNFNFYVHYKVS